MPWLREGVVSQSHGWDALVAAICLEAAWQTYRQRMFFAGFGSHIGDRLEFAQLLTEHLSTCCGAPRAAFAFEGGGELPKSVWNCSKCGGAV